MNGYSKMRQPFNNQKPKSSSDSDLFSFPQVPHKNNVKTIPNEESKSHNIINKFHSSPIQVEDEKKIDFSHLKSSGSGSGRSFSMNLFKLSKQSSGKSNEKSLSSTVESAVKKVMPMRRSSSVSSERYCRIMYDDFLELDEEEEEEGNMELAAETTSTNNKMKKMGNRVRILKACKRIFGF